MKMLQRQTSSPILPGKKRPRTRKAGAAHRRLAFEDLEVRHLLSDLCIVPLWDGERVDGAGAGQTVLNYFGGGLGASSGATVTYATQRVHAGQGAYRIDLSGPIAQGNFAFVQTTLGATGFPAPYMDSAT